jgi:predicted lactoylglutathione lyase
VAAVDSVVLQVPDPAATEALTAALGVGRLVRARASDEPTTGFRGFTLSLVVAGPGTVDALLATAAEHGAEPLKPAAKSFWGYGGVVRAPDGTIWKVATSARKDAGPVRREADSVALLLGVADVRASRRFYVERGLAVDKSFGGKYVQFAGGPVTLALYGRRALAKDAGVPVEGGGSHRLLLRGDAGPVTDPDGFAWEVAERTGSR